MASSFMVGSLILNQIKVWLIIVRHAVKTKALLRVSNPSPPISSESRTSPILSIEVAPYFYTENSDKKVALVGLKN